MILTRKHTTSPDVTIDRVPARSGAAFADPVDLALATQNDWWLALLARVDAALDDDLSGMAPNARLAAVAGAWAAQVGETPGSLALAALGAGDVRHRATGRRYARLLALFAGRADVTDDADTAADAGVALVHELCGSPEVLSAAV
jgi:hypothetical protein